MNRARQARLAQLAASLTLVGSTTLACGGSASDASTEDFCDAITGVVEVYGEVDGDDPTEEQVAGVKEAVAELADTGTPEDISDDARQGFELITEEIAALDDDASAEELEKAGEDFSGDEEKQTEAFDDYLEETCAAPE